jgi:Icc-related predicted phosphoesterase
MKIAVYSDLHHEWFRKGETLPELKTDADVVVLAGDIASGAEGVEWAKREFTQPVVIICGNHEHYKRNLRETVRACREAAAGSHVHFLENDAVVISGVRFLGCTLWTDLDLFGEDERQRCSIYVSNFITDFKVIGYGPEDRNLLRKKLKPSEMRWIHLQSRAWLEERFAEGFDGDTVVVSHHLPSVRSVAERFLGNEPESLLSAAFASRMDGEIERWKPRLWIHGHAHDSCDYTIGATRVLCNPRGYPGEMNPGFGRDFVVEI